VAYLEKSKGSEEYHQILDFLNGSTLRSNEAPPTPGQPAGGAEEHDALTTLSSKLYRCMDNIGALETELNETNKTLGGAVMTLIGRVKHLEVQLKKS
ncbi:hypothetical protein Tco_0447651, partial [Tanacetum coccineum]